LSEIFYRKPNRSYKKCSSTEEMFLCFSVDYSNHKIDLVVGIDTQMAIFGMLLANLKAV